MENEFFQNGPELCKDNFLDKPLGKVFASYLDREMIDEATTEIEKFHRRGSEELLELSKMAESSPPVHRPYDPWGRRIDEIQVSEAWNQLTEIATEEGCIATAYEQKYAEFSRAVQFAKLFIFHPVSAFVSCPLAMTDGAAKTIQLYGNEALQSKEFCHLTSRDPKNFWTSGQWMTEKRGGSDVSGTETVAKKAKDGGFYLSGTKWFTSATTSQIALALARVIDDEPGSRGLSLFLVNLRDEQGYLRNIKINRLKKKMGTDALPTAELTLEGTPALLVGEQGGGVKKISSQFNITRLHNTVCALAATNHALELAEDYSKKRVVFGKKLADQPLFAQVLAENQATLEGYWHLTMHAAILLGLDETGKAYSEEKVLLRLLTPILKMVTANFCMSATSEVLEMLGGAGYIEDTGLPKLFRDAKVFSIWEGATNVLALDVLRTIAKEDSLTVWYNCLNKKLAEISSDSVRAEKEIIQLALNSVISCMHDPKKLPNQEVVERSARELSSQLANIYICSLLLDYFLTTRIERARLLLRYWCDNHISEFKLKQSLPFT